MSMTRRATEVTPRAVAPPSNCSRAHRNGSRSLALDNRAQCCGVYQPALARLRIGAMVIRIGMELAAKISPSDSQAESTCSRLPAVLSLQDRSVRDSSWRNGTVASAGRRGGKGGKGGNLQEPAIPDLSKASKWRHRPAQTGGNLPAWARRDKILRSIRWERIILRGALAVQSHEAESLAGQKIRGEIQCR